MEKLKRFSMFRILTVLLLAGVFLFFTRVLYLVGDYYKVLDAYSGDIIRGDQLAARQELENLKRFYELNEKLKPFKLNWVADKYLFAGTNSREAAYDSLTNRHDRVVERLKDENDFWSRYIRANSTWRIAQGIFEQSLKKDTKTKLEEQKKADELAYSTKEDYEEAVKLDKGRWLPPKWNYDLTTNADSRAAALMPKPGVIKVKLGLGGKKNKGMGKDKGRGEKGEGQQDLPIEGPPTDGKPKPKNNRPG